MPRRHPPAFEIAALAALGLGTIAGILGLATLVALAIPDGRHVVCLKVDGAVATIHTGQAACAAPEEISEL